jgi:catechol 2,3-dioxygenase-like lactoylglutathione lyase family enzyme
VTIDHDQGSVGIGVIGIDHVQLTMPLRGEPAARQFYAAVLGLHEVAKPASLAGRGGCWFAGPGGTAIHLGVDDRFIAARKGHPCLIVADLAVARRALIAAGVRVDDGDPDIGLARCYTTDPFGNRIELVDATDAGFTSRPRDG